MNTRNVSNDWQNHRFSDDERLRGTGKRKFSDADVSSEKPFANVFDDGFRNKLDASMEDQSCMPEVLKMPWFLIGGCASTVGY